MYGIFLFGTSCLEFSCLVLGSFVHPVLGFRNLRFEFSYVEVHCTYSVRFQEETEFTHHF